MNIREAFEKEHPIFSDPAQWTELEIKERFEFFKSGYKSGFDAGYETYEKEEVAQQIQDDYNRTGR